MFSSHRAERLPAAAGDRGDELGRLGVERGRLRVAHQLAPAARRPLAKVPLLDDTARRGRRRIARLCFRLGQINKESGPGMIVSSPRAHAYA